MQKEVYPHWRKDFPGFWGQQGHESGKRGSLGVEQKLNFSSSLEPITSKFQQVCVQKVTHVTGKALSPTIQACMLSARVRQPAGEIMQ